MEAFKNLELEIPGVTNVYNGKVRDVYTVNNEFLVMVCSDRISAFDHILPQAIPYKGQVLNQIAAKFLKATEDIVPNWVLDVPGPRVTIGRYCEPFMIEMVIRGYNTGHCWREYKSGKREICGVPLPEGLKEHDRFETPLLTPTIKATSGHDEDITREEIISQGIVSEEDYLKLEDYTRKLFARGTEMAKERGLILVDTKYEFGKASDGKIYLIDEINTPDSSRFFYLEGYEERQAAGEKQKQLSKEFVREWLMANGFQGKEGQTIPTMPDEFVNSVTERYIELHDKILGENFNKVDETKESLEAAIRGSLEKLNVSA